MFAIADRLEGEWSWWREHNKESMLMKTNCFTFLYDAFLASLGMDTKSV